MRRSPNAAQRAYLEAVAAAAADSPPAAARIGAVAADVSSPIPASTAGTSPAAATGPAPTAAPSLTAAAPAPARPAIVFRSVPVSSAPAPAAVPDTPAETVRPAASSRLTWDESLTWLRDRLWWLLPLIAVALLFALAAQAAEPEASKASVSVVSVEDAASTPVVAPANHDRRHGRGRHAPPRAPQTKTPAAALSAPGPAAPTPNSEKSLPIGLILAVAGAAVLVGAAILALAWRSAASNRRTFGGGGKTGNAGTGDEQPPGTFVAGREVPAGEPRTTPEEGSEGGATAPAPWTIGFATHPGLVRYRNEDAGAAFSIGGHQVAIVADGLGGMPLGAEASALTVRAVEQSIRRGWQLTSPGRSPAPAILLHAAMAAAAEALTAEGLLRGFASPRDGLRTTLIVAVAAPERYHFAYIGDGGLFAVRANGVFEALMTPHKAAGGALNELAASLGPYAHGAPVIGAAAREPGDLLIVATDGVADRAAPRFYTDLLVRQARRYNGDLAVAAARMLAILANHREAGLYRFDDNMTLALIGDGRQPPEKAELARAADADAARPARAADQALHGTEAA
jgi:PPM family protein phosphatase